VTGRLSLATLGQLPGEVRRPAYAPDAVGCGIVHLGIGAFHRAHQAVYLDDLIAGGAGNWRIIGVSLRSAEVRDQLAPQDGLFTIVEREGAEERLRIIGSVATVLVAPENPAAVIAAIASPDTHIVSLTVTEKGYCHAPASGTLLTSHPDIAHDLAHPSTPRSAIGYLAAGLDLRRNNGGGPITIMSCDNLPHNGAVLRAVLGKFAEMRDPALAQWIDANASFPATMVDRIVPATTSADRERLQARLGIEDRAMVKAEPFTQWVIEDDFAGPRPPFEQAGAQMVADVRPFELAKLRMLNGAHSTIAYMGLAAGYVTVDQAIADPAIAAVVDRLMRVEAAATLPPVPGLDTTLYADALLKRFGNAALEHKLAQIAMDGSQKLPQRLLGTIADVHASGGTATAAARGVAAWIRHLSGPHVNDPLGDVLTGLAMGAATDNALLDAVLGVSAVFGDLGNQRWFRRLIGEALAA
jgi:fructuronate reductase